MTNQEILESLIETASRVHAISTDAEIIKGLADQQGIAPPLVGWASVAATVAGERLDDVIASMMDDDQLAEMIASCNRNAEPTVNNTVSAKCRTLTWAARARRFRAHAERRSAG